MHRFSKVFIFVGLVLLLTGIYLLWERQTPKRLTFYHYNVVQTPRQGNIFPTEIEIPAASIKLSVYKAAITNSNWESTTEGVSYLSSSPNPGEKGNSILYGHNWTSLLGNLTHVKPKDKIVIIFNNGSKRTFIVKATATVDPNQVSILSQANDKRITLYTCTGFLDSKRFVAVANLDKL